MCFEVLLPQLLEPLQSLKFVSVGFEVFGGNLPLPQVVGLQEAREAYIHMLGIVGSCCWAVKSDNPVWTNAERVLAEHATTASLNPSYQVY